MPDLLKTTSRLLCQPTLTEKEIEDYLEERRKKGIQESSLGKYRVHLLHLYRWLPEPKQITKELLLNWREELESCGKSKLTVQKYVTDINTYLRAVGCEVLCTSKTNAIDLRGQVFGYLTAIEPTEKRHRKDVIWRCRCRCGNEVEVPCTLLRTGNTTSCGCLNREILKYANQYIEGTSLRQAMDDRVTSSRNTSGFVGVFPKRNKWAAFIMYKGVRHYLGTYSRIEDAVKARTEAKMLVMDDATELLELYLKEACFRAGQTADAG